MTKMTIQQIEQEWRESRLSATERIKVFGDEALPTIKAKLDSLKTEITDEQSNLDGMRQVLKNKLTLKLPETDTEIKLKREGVWFGEQIIETFYQPRFDSLKKELALVEGAVRIIKGDIRYQSFQSKLEQARRVSIVDIAGEYVIRLRKSGPDRYTARCCFHEDRTPSLVFYEQTNSFYCFGCGEYGDVIAFLRKVENISFKQAVLALTMGARTDD